MNKKKRIAQTRASNKYNTKAYDRFSLMLKKGQKDELKNIAESRGQSLNGFINEAIEEKLANEAGVERYEE